MREQYDLMEPLPQGHAELLGRLDACERERDIGRARLLAELDESLEAMAHAANRQPRAVGVGRNGRAVARPWAPLSSRALLDLAGKIGKVEGLLQKRTGQSFPIDNDGIYGHENDRHSQIFVPDHARQRQSVRLVGP